MLIFKPKRMHVTCENCGASEGDAPASLPGLCLEPIKGLTAPPPPPPKKTPLFRQAPAVRPPFLKSANCPSPPFYAIPPSHLKIGFFCESP